MKALVVGGGSIGTRHLRNLRTLGVESLAVVEPAAARRSVLAEQEQVPVFEALSEGLDWEPDLAVIATPTNLHFEQALQAARRNCHLFVEKPLTHHAELMTDLADEIERRKLVSLVGCNMRFHPGPVQVHALLQDKAIGRLLFARVHAGYYLPSWRPTQDYRQSYSAQASMGGGCLLDCIHEIDLARWYLGDVRDVFCCMVRSGSLEIDVEDIAILVCTHRDGVVSEIHLDYVQRSYERGCQIVGERGSIFWDYGAGAVRWYNAGQNSWQSYPHPQAWETNQMYLDEMRHFLECVNRRRATTLPVPEAMEVMRIVFAARASASSGQKVNVSGNIA